MAGPDEPLILHLTSELERRAADRGLEVHPAYIYVVEAIGLGLFKIGQSLDFKNRFSAYRVCCPVDCRLTLLALVPKADLEAIERALHSRLQSRWVRGEWFALTPDDVAALPRTVKDVASQPLRRLAREIGRTGELRLDPMRPAMLRRLEAKMAQARAANAVPMDELIMDRLEYARQCGTPIDATEITRQIDRKPQHVHEAIRCLITAGAIALVEPRRNPADGAIWLDAYRYCDLTIPDETCDWELTICGLEIQVSEPLGDMPEEFLGRRHPLRA